MDLVAQYISDIVKKWLKHSNVMKDNPDMISNQEIVGSIVPIEMSDKAIIRLHNQNEDYIATIEELRERLGIETVEHGTLKIKYDKLKAENELFKAKWYIKLSNKLQDINLPKISIKW